MPVFAAQLACAAFGWVCAVGVGHAGGVGLALLCLALDFFAWVFLSGPRVHAVRQAVSIRLSRCGAAPFGLSGVLNPPRSSRGLAVRMSPPKHLAAA